MRLALTETVVLLLASIVSGSSLPKRNFVPNEKTAVAIAEAVLKPIYGEKHIVDEEPFRGKLTDGIWTVSGTLYCHDSKGTVISGSNCRGGTAEVKLSKEDGRVLSVNHYK